MPGTAGAPAKSENMLPAQEKHEKRVEQAKNIETNLLNIQIEQKKLQAEFDKIPESAKTIAQRKRREELEREINILNRNISSLKSKLRDMGAL